MTLVALVSAGVSFPLAAASDRAQQPAHEASAPIAPSSQASSTAVPSYPNTTKGLEKFVKDMLKLAKEGDSQQLALYAKSLALPDPAGWFIDVFGSHLGPQLAMQSNPGRASLETTLPAMLSQELAGKRTDVEVLRFDDSCNPRATEIEYPFLLLRQRQEPLYDVRFLGGSMANVWSYLAYVDGAFRFVGNLKVKGLSIPQPQPHPPGTGRIVVAGVVTEAKRIHATQPVYPPEAKAADVQGTVVLDAIIATDGSLRSLHVIEGQCWLAQSALVAVRDWQYRPTLLNGQPVEVDTTIKVFYTLGR